MLSLLAVFFGPAASFAEDKDADKLREQRTKLNRGINQGQSQLDQISAQLIQANAALVSAQNDLMVAQNRLAETREQVRQAEILDHRMQLKLNAAVLQLQNARQDLREGRAMVASQRTDLASIAVENYQNSSLNLMSIDAAFGSHSLQDAIDEMQANETVLDQQDVNLQELQAHEVLLELTEARVEAAKVEVARKRAAAAQNLLTKQNLEAAAEAQAQDVAHQVEVLRIARETVAAAKGNELKRLKTLETERNRVLEQLRRLAEQRARERQLQGKPKSGSGFLNYPVADTYVTSPYGMRFHPVLHVWKLHDGTDLHAPCYRPIYASADGVVVGEYYNGGYGNVILLDHGVVKGVSLATSYNHLTAFVAKPGERVKRGALIGYAGTTGYSTGCHLHFMVYVDGYTVDPMYWL